MPYSESVVSRISRNTTSVEGATFNYPIYCASHMYFADTERTRAYSSWDDIKADTDIPEGSVVYNAAKAIFSQEISPEIVFIGRREADSVSFTPSVVANSVDYGFSVIVTETATGTAVTTTPSITSDADATAAEIATALFTDADAAGTNEIANVTVADDTGSISVTPDTGFTIQLVDTTRLVDTYTSTETAAELKTAISDEEDEWYFISCEDNGDSFVLDMAAEIEATGGTNAPKMYFVSTSDANSIVAETDPANDLIGSLKTLGYNRTVAYWQSSKVDQYIECAAVGYNGVYQAGGTTWKFMQLKGISVASDPVTGKTLSKSKQGYIKDRNGNWMGKERGISDTKEGKVVGGEWIDVIRGTDWLNDSIEVALQTLLRNQRGGKIAMTDKDLKKVTNTVDNVLHTAVKVGFLKGFVPTSVPKAIDIPFVDQVARLLENITWKGYLAGAVHKIVVDGNLTYEQSELV